MCLSSATRAKQTTVGLLLNPATTGQFEYLLFMDSRGCRKVKRFQVLVHWEARLLDPSLESIGRARTQLQFRQMQ